MMVVIQRVNQAQVSVHGKIISRIGQGLLILVGVHKSDGDSDVEFLAKKIPTMRIFADPAGKMNLSLLDIRGELLLVSQFTLGADVYSGRRPSFTESAPPELATKLLTQLVGILRNQGITVQTGEFAAHMEVGLVNDGPVTFVLDSKTAILRPKS